MKRQRPEPGRDPGPDDWFIVGAPVAGSSASMGLARADGVGAIRAADQCFDPDAFLTWADSVFRRANGAWRSRNPELLRPVMAQPVWDRYAQFLLTASIVALSRTLMASAVATARLAGADADEVSQSVLISYAVTITSAQASLIPERGRNWHERWLFQRPADGRTHVSGSVAVCLVCGGPADPADSGRCPYCHADIITRTAGWLVTQVATTMPGAPKLARGPSAAASGGGPIQPPRAG